MRSHRVAAISIWLWVALWGLAWGSSHALAQDDEDDQSRSTQGVLERMTRRVQGRLERAEVALGGQASAPRVREPAAVERLRVFHNADPARTLVMVLRNSTTDEVEAVDTILAAVNADLEGRGRHRVGFHLLLQDPRLLAQASLTQVTSSTVVLGDDLDWLQDLGEFGVASLRGQAAPQRVLVHTGSYEQSPKLTRALARVADADQVPLHRGLDPADLGGNIEATPDDFLLLGRGASPLLEAFFQERGYRDRLLRLDVDWLFSHHVDEVLSIVPERGPGRGYAVLRADPARARALIAALPPDEWEDQLAAAIENAQEGGERHPSSLTEDRTTLEDVLTQLAIYREGLGWGGVPTRNAPLQRIFRRLEEANQVADRMLGLVGPLARELAARGGRPVPVVSLPALYRIVLDKPVLAALGAAPANMVVLDGHLLVPDPLLPVFRDDILATGARLGYRVHFVPSLTQMRLHGFMHCATQVIRERAPGP